MAEGRALRRTMPAAEIGWCHSCGTLQLLRDAPWLPVGWVYGDDQPVPCCVVCRHEEPWEFGVFAMPDASRECAAAQHVSWAPLPCEVCGGATVAHGGSSDGQHPCRPTPTPL